MQPMRPMPGMGGGYWNTDCSLRVCVVYYSYDEKEEIESIGLRVEKIIEQRFPPKFRLNDEFLFSRRVGEELGLTGDDGLTLDSLAQ